MLKGTVNHGGNLPKEYFISYLKLVMTSRELTVEEAKEFTFENFFKGDYNHFGPNTFQQFILAFNKLSHNE